MSRRRLVRSDSRDDRSGGPPAPQSKRGNGDGPLSAASSDAGTLKSQRRPRRRVAPRFRPARERAHWRAGAQKFVDHQAPDAACGSRHEDTSRSRRGSRRGRRTTGCQVRASPSTCLAREPSTTPPTAATSSTIDVTSKASRWSVRKSLPIASGEPKER